MANKTDIDKAPEASKSASKEAINEVLKKTADAPDKVSAKLKTKTESKSKSIKPKKEKIKRAPKKPVSFGTAAFMSLLAAIAGGLIGGIGPRLIDPNNAAPADAIARNQASLRQIGENVSAQGKTLSAVQEDLAGANNTLGNVSRLTGRITALERADKARANIDISAERDQAIAPLVQKIDIIETLMQTEDMPEGAPSALLARLDEMQAQIEGIKLTAIAAQSAPIISYREGSSDGRSKDAPESLGQRNDPNPEVGQNRAYDLVDNFPRAQMLAALAVQTRSTEDPSWLRKIFEKHVEVRDANVIDPRSVILEAERLTKADDISGAIAAIETLNPTLRAAAQSWLIEAKKTL